MSDTLDKLLLTKMPKAPAMSSDQILEGRIFSDKSDIEPGHFVSFRLLKLVGQGGMGIVYQAEQNYPRRIVALKVMKMTVLGSSHAARFDREISVLARLQHPHISQLYSVGEVRPQLGADAPFIAMEYVEGSNILEYANTQKLSLHQKLDLMARICEVVAYAHANGVVHRDLKPSNILVDKSGVPKILDFGLAMVSDAQWPMASTITEDGQLLGTLDYMSPEQAAGKPEAIDHRTDVYALGVILFELLTGRRPFDLSSCTVVEALRRMEDQEVSRLSNPSQGFNRDLEVIAHKALNREREQRYPSAEALASDLRRFLADEPIWARRPTIQYRLTKFIRRHRFLVLAVALIVASLSLGLILALRQTRRANTEAALAAAHERESRLQLARVHLSEGQAHMMSSRFDLARESFSLSREKFQSLGESTYPVELATWELDFRSARPLYVIDPQTTRTAQAVAISPDKRWFAIGFPDGKVELRLTATNQARLSISLSSNVQWLKFSTDCRVLLIGCNDYFEAWDLTSETKIYRDNKPPTRTSLIAADGNQVVTCLPREIRVRPLSLPDEVQAISIPVDAPQLLAMSRGNFLVVDATSAVFKVSKEGETIALGSLTTDSLWKATVSPDGSKLALATQDVRVFDAATLRPLGRFENYGQCLDFGFIDNNSLWLQNLHEPTIDFVQIGGKVLTRIPQAANLRCSAFDDLSITSDRAGRLMLWASPLYSVAHPLATDECLLGTSSLSPDGHVMAIGTKNGSVRLADTQFGLLLGELPLGSVPRHLQFSADGEHLAIATSEKQVQVLDLLSLSHAIDQTANAAVRVLAIAPDGRTVFISLQGQDGVLSYQAAIHVTQKFDMPFEVSAMAVSPKGSYLAAAGGDEAQIWTLRGKPQLVAQLRLKPPGSNRIAFGNDESTVFLNDELRHLCAWDLSTQKCDPLKGLPADIKSWQLAGDRLVFLQGSSLGSYNLRTGRIEYSLQAPYSIENIAADANGTRILGWDKSQVAFFDWSVPGSLYAIDAPGSPDMRLFNLAGAMGVIMGNYSGPNPALSNTASDGYGFLLAGRYSEAQRAFAHSPELTPATRSLLVGAARQFGDITSQE